MRGPIVLIILVLTLYPGHVRADTPVSKPKPDIYRRGQWQQWATKRFPIVLPTQLLFGPFDPFSNGHFQTRARRSIVGFEAFVFFQSPMLLLFRGETSLIFWALNKLSLSSLRWAWASSIEPAKSFSKWKNASPCLPKLQPGSGLARHLGLWAFFILAQLSSSFGLISGYSNFCLEPLSPSLGLFDPYSFRQSLFRTVFGRCSCVWLVTWSQHVSTSAYSSARSLQCYLLMWSVTLARLLSKTIG